MKNLKQMNMFFVLLLTIIFPSITKADLLPPSGSHNVDLCNTVVNLNDFPNINVIEHSSGPTSDPTKGMLVVNGKCFNKNTYKFANLELYWATTDNLKSINLNNLTSEDFKKLILLGKNIPVTGGTSPDSSHIIKQNDEYSLVQSTNGDFILYKSKSTHIYDDSRPNSIENFKSPTDNQQVIVDPVQPPIPTPINQPTKSFWQKILCFFGIGNNC